VKQPVPNVGENWRPKGVLCEETADTRSILRRKSVTGPRIVCQTCRVFMLSNVAS
jgi:hypothetical protein